MPLHIQTLSVPEVQGLLQGNPGLDLLTFNFQDTAAAHLLSFGAIERSRAIAGLMAYQRVLRLLPAPSAPDALPTAWRLIVDGFDSAHRIGSLPEHRFVTERAPMMSGGEDAARHVHRRAVHARMLARQVWANVKDTVAARHFRGALFGNVDPEMAGVFSSLPGYADLFGGQDYCRCAQCASLFSPSAYFLDLMRVTDEYITYPTAALQGAGTISFTAGSTQATGAGGAAFDASYIGCRLIAGNDVRTIVAVADATTLTVDTSWSAAGDNLAYRYARTAIPLGERLEDRRPDLFDLALTCENADREVPYLDVVNGVLEAIVRRRSGTGDPYRALATATYPFDLPYNLPLTRIRAYLAALETSLSDLFAACALPTSTQSIEYLGMSLEQARVVTTEITTLPGLTPLYGLDVAARMPRPGAGTITIATGATTAQGAGTQFGTQVGIDDQIIVAGQTRTVVGLDVPAQTLTVDAPWTADAANAPYTVRPAGSLDIAMELAERAGIDRAALGELFVQGLGAAELQAGIADSFFINAGASGVPRLSIVYDRSDPMNYLELVTGLADGGGAPSVPRFDRLTRFIRLRAALGWSYAELDWAIASVTPTATPRRIDQPTVDQLAAIERLRRRTGLPVEVLCGLWYNVKTIGRGDGISPRDPFDVIFNNPLVLGGANPYADPTVPFDPSRSTPWTIAGGAGTDAVIRKRLVAALLVSDNDLTTIATFLDSVLGSPDGMLTIDLPTLSALYRHTKLPALLGITIDAYLRLLSLLFYPDASYGAPGPRPEIAALSVASVARIVAAADWLATSPFDIYDLHYVITGAPNPVTDPGYTSGGIRPFLDGLATSSEGAHLTAGALLTGNVDIARATEILAALVAAGIVTPIGIIRPGDISAATLAFTFPIDASSTLVTADIDPAQALAAFAALAAHGVIVAAEGATTGTLSPGFDAATDLGYLFPGDPAADRKQSETREILLGIRADIDHTVRTVLGARALQESNAELGLATFLDADPTMLVVLLPFVGPNVVGLDDYLQALLTPLPEADPIPPALDHLFTALAQALLLVRRLGMTTTDARAVIGHESSFGIADLADLTFANIQTLDAYRRLVTDFHDVDGRWAAYFAMPAAGPDCAGSTNTAALAAITGWSAAQICELIAFLQPRVPLDPGTVSGVVLLREVFTKAALMGVDISFVKRLCGLGGLLSGANWEELTTVAGLTLAAVDGKYDDDRFAELMRTLAGSLNPLNRDALLGYVMWLLAPGLPLLRKPSDLYQFLLIDVEMSGCATTSRIVQAISSVQLYMQRCRIGVEAGVGAIGIPDVWWEWISTYRAWEVNRKIFLYPENYLDPTLRPNATPLFDELKESLLQSNITSETIDRSYRSYFDEFISLGGLVPCESFVAPLKDAGTGGINHTLFLFGRSATAPYTFHYRTFEHASNTWTPWTRIELTIDAFYITPVFAYERLFLLWVDPTSVTFTSFSGGEDHKSVSYTARVKYTYFDTQKRWIEPQTMSKTFPVKFTPDSYNADLFIDPELIDPSALFWRKASVVHLPGPALLGGEHGGEQPGAEPPVEEILVTLGAIYRLPTDPITVPSPPDPNGNPDKYQFDLAIYNTALRAQGAIDHHNPRPGYILLDTGSTIGENLLEGTPFVLLFDYDDLQDEPQPYRAWLDTTNAGLGVIATTNVLYDNAYGDRVPAGDPVGVEAPLATFELLHGIDLGNARLTMVKNQPGWFLFDNGDEQFLFNVEDPNIRSISEIVVRIAGSVSGYANELDLRTAPYTTSSIPFQDLHFRVYRLSTSTIGPLRRRMVTGGIDALLTIEAQKLPELPFSRFTPTASVVVPEHFDQLDFYGAYGLYFRELFLHAPWLVADRLVANQRFDEARRWYQYIFDPTSPSEPGDQHPNDRFWRYLPFRSMTIETLRQMLTNPQQIAAYNGHPFDPFAVADLRPVAYAKGVVMKYLDNLLKWGDFLFAQDTRESIEQATNLYVLASDLLGPRPRSIGDCPRPAPSSVRAIMDRYIVRGEEIPEFLVQVENLTSGWSSGSSSGDGVSYAHVPFNEIDSYFCAPENGELIAYWDLVEDRLYKIRHCMNIGGIERALPLLAPPLDPRALVRSAATGQAGAPVESPLEPPIPYYRFGALLDRARSLTSTLMQLGASLQAALERRDAEQLALLQTTQEQTLLELTTYIKQQQLVEIAEQGDSLQQSLLNARTRVDFYTGMLAEGLSDGEVLNIAATIAANYFNIASGVLKTASSIAYLIPNVGSPFAMTYGGREIGASIQAAGSYMDLLSSIGTFVAGLSLTMAGYERRAQEWDLQARLATTDAAQIEAMIAANQTSARMAERDLETHLRSIEQSREMESYLRSKFTNAELYQWMAGRLAGIYFQTYTLAFDLARSAQRAYRYETGADATFINFGYWDSLHKGLLAGEGLMLALGQMEKAYLDGNARALEIRKTISLMQLDPAALLELKTTGTCAIDLSEQLFDRDYPGHYRRKITSIAITIPAVAGPYQNIRATLTQLTNKTIMKPDIGAVRYLLGDPAAPAPGADVLRSNVWINQQVALSSGNADTGMFELDFNDERYLPFEGTGVVSSWRLSMPPAANRFDFASISDVVLQVAYTALDGGARFRDQVTAQPAVRMYQGTRLFSMSQEYAESWFTLMHDHANPATQTLRFDLPRGLVPPHVDGARLTDIYLRVAVPAGTATVSATPFLVLDVTPSLSVEMPLTAEGDFAIKLAPEVRPLMSEVLAGSRALTFRLANLPACDPGDPCLKRDGFLDPGVLTNVFLILNFDGDLQW